MNKNDIDIIEIVNEENAGIDKKPSSKRKKKKKKKIKTTRKHKLKVAALVGESVVIVLLACMIALLVIPNAKAKLAGTWIGKMFIKSVFSEETWEKIVDDDFDRDDTGINDDLKSLDGYLNIALFGVDSRYGDLLEGNNSDTMIIVSINEETKQVKMASLYRDTFLRCMKNSGEFYYGKLNSSYIVGGPLAAVKTINSNYDFDIKDYVTINFAGMATVIDKLGGIDVTVTEKEAWYINGYLTETRKITGMDAPDVPVQAGTLHLTGLQATAYCRIRYTAFYYEDGTSVNDDYGRTARQRSVITKMIDKAKAAGVDAVLGMADEIFEEDSNIFLTSIPYDDIIELIPVLLEFAMGDSMGFPVDHVKYVDPTYGDSVLSDDLATNVVLLHEFLFNDEDYVPSATVLGINEQLCDIGGIYEKYNTDSEPDSE